MARQKSDRLLFIDGLRGWAALAVVFFHVYFQWTSPIYPTLARLPESVQWVLGHGFLGVEVFFVLSGMVIARSVRRDRITIGFLGNFALRRSIRLDPPYWIIIAVTVTLKWVMARIRHHAGGYESPGFTWKDILSNLVYLQTILGSNQILIIGWTLCLEVMFYVTYVLLLGGAQRLANNSPASGSKPSTTGLLVVFLPLFFCSIWYWYIHGFVEAVGERNGLRNYLGYWHMFMLGSILQWAIDGWISGKAFISTVGVTLILSAGQIIWRPADARGIVAALVAMSIFAAGRWNKWDRWLADPFSQTVGTISYSLYLVHMAICAAFFTWIVQRWGQHVWTAVIGVPIYLGITLAVAYVFNRCVEQPSLRLSHRFRRERDDVTLGQACAR